MPTSPLMHPRTPPSAIPVALRCAAGPLGLLLGLACGSGGGSIGPTPPAAPPAPRVYRGTASAGDFIQLTLRSDPDRLEWRSLLRSVSGGGPLTLNPDGSYGVADSAGYLKTLHERPGASVAVRMDRAGLRSEAALLAGVSEVPIHKADLPGGRWNLMQFRTTEGGFEVGCVLADASGNLSHQSYIPTRQAGPYTSGGIPAVNLVDNPGGWIDATVPEEGGGSSAARIFGTPGGYLDIDTPRGSMIGLRQAATSAFDPAHAGTYVGSFYRKLATLAGGGTETGTPETGQLYFTVLASGHVTLQPAGGGALEDDLKPFEGSSFQGPGRITDPCRGLFLFNDGSTQPARVIFMGFTGDALAFGSVRSITSSQYDYVYGFAPRASFPVFQPFGFPIADPAQIKRSAAWGIPNWSGSEPHNGIDFQLKDGLASILLVSPTAGQILDIVTRDNPYSHPPNQFMVVVRIAVNNEWLVDLTLEPSSLDPALKAAQLAAVKVTKGQTVSTGTPIADLLAGTLGYPHLHYMTTRFGASVCPYAYSTPQAKQIMDGITQIPGSSPQGVVCVTGP